MKKTKEKKMSSMHIDDIVMKHTFQTTAMEYLIPLNDYVEEYLL